MLYTDRSQFSNSLRVSIPSQVAGRLFLSWWQKHLKHEDIQDFISPVAGYFRLSPGNVESKRKHPPSNVNRIMEYRKFSTYFRYFQSTFTTRLQGTFWLVSEACDKKQVWEALRCLQHEINLRQMTWHVMREHPPFDTLWTLLPFGDFPFLPKTIATPSIMRTMAAMAGHLSQTLPVWRLALKNMTWICWYGWRKIIGRVCL